MGRLIRCQARDIDFYIDGPRWWFTYPLRPRERSFVRWRWLWASLMVGLLILVMASVTYAVQKPWEDGIRIVHLYDADMAHYVDTAAPDWPDVPELVQWEGRYFLRIDVLGYYFREVDGYQVIVPEP